MNAKHIELVKVKFFCIDNIFMGKGNIGAANIFCRKLKHSNNQFVSETSRCRRKNRTALS